MRERFITPNRGGINIHLIWESLDSYEGSEAMLEYLASTDLKILNRSREATFFTRVRTKVLGVTLVSRHVKSSCKGWKFATKNFA